MDSIIIKACLNGNRGREDNPNVPWTPQEVADEAVRCYNAGASIVHMHARHPDGRVSYDTEWYAEAEQAHQGEVRPGAEPHHGQVLGRARGIGVCVTCPTLPSLWKWCR